MQNIVFVASEVGIGNCWISVLDEEVAKNVSRFKRCSGRCRMNASISRMLLCVRTAGDVTGAKIEEYINRK